MDDGGGVVCVGVSDRERAVAVAALAVAAADWVYMLYAVPLGRAMHRGGREAGSSPCTNMEQQGQAPALVTLGPCR